MSDSINQSVFNEAVCVDTGRVYDSCMDRDCIENARVYFNEAGQTAAASAISCRVKTCEVDDVEIDVEPIAFKRGYYSCDLTFYFTILAEIATDTTTPAQEYEGIIAYSKKVILCGGEGNVKTFTSNVVATADDVTVSGTNLPKCTVQCVDPVILDSKICNICSCAETITNVPESVLENVGGEIQVDAERALFVTLGLFSIVQLVRNVQILVPSYDFCMPQKDCDDTIASPCEMFQKISFPVDEFFPQSCDVGDNNNCCNNNSNNTNC